MTSHLMMVGVGGSPMAPQPSPTGHGHDPSPDLPALRPHSQPLEQERDTPLLSRRPLGRDWLPVGVPGAGETWGSGGMWAVQVSRCLQETFHWVIYCNSLHRCCTSVLLGHPNVRCSGGPDRVWEDSRCFPPCLGSVRQGGVSLPTVRS